MLFRLGIIILMLVLTQKNNAQYNGYYHPRYDPCNGDHFLAWKAIRKLEKEAFKLKKEVRIDSSTLYVLKYVKNYRWYKNHRGIFVHWVSQQKSHTYGCWSRDGPWLFNYISDSAFKNAEIQDTLSNRTSFSARSLLQCDTTWHRLNNSGKHFKWIKRHSFRKLKKNPNGTILALNNQYFIVVLNRHSSNEKKDFGGILYYYFERKE